MQRLGERMKPQDFEYYESKVMIIYSYTIEESGNTEFAGGKTCLMPV